MEWMNRGAGQGQPAGAPTQPAPGTGHTAKRQNDNLGWLRSMRLAQVALLFLTTALVVAVIWFVALGGNKQSEASLVDSKRLQAVFLNGGQVYFGNISDLNGKFLSMSNIYYLRVNQQVQPNQSSSNSANDISLVKLGCELHGPQDSMVINREQVVFWENLKDDGQVAKAVKDYKTKNPGDQKCDQTSSQSSNGTGTSTTPSTTTTPATNTNTTTNSSTTKKTN